MKRLLIGIFFLLASVWLGLEIITHPGYLLLVYGPWTIQMPVWLALLGTVLLLSLFYILIDGLGRLQLTWYRIKNWLSARKEQQFYSKTQQGVALLIEGKWKLAESLLIKDIQTSHHPLVNYVGAAEAAHEQNHFAKRDDYLQKAREIIPKAKLAIDLIEAELALDAQQVEQSKAILLALHTTYPRHPRVLALLQKIYVRLGEWHQLREILPLLCKTQQIQTQDRHHFEAHLEVELLRQAAKINLAALQAEWQSKASRWKKNADVLYTYLSSKSALLATEMNQEDFAKEAENLIRRQLKTEWHTGLAEIYRTLPHTDLNRQLVIVGGWTKTYGQQPVLLFMLAQICKDLKLWGRSKEYFEKCLTQDPSSAVFLAYGELLEYLQEMDKALSVYRRGLKRNLMDQALPIAASTHALVTHEPVVT